MEEALPAPPANYRTLMFSTRPEMQPCLPFAARSWWIRACGVESCPAIRRGEGASSHPSQSTWALMDRTGSCPPHDFYILAVKFSSNLPRLLHRGQVSVVSCKHGRNRHDGWSQRTGACSVGALVI